MERWRFSLGTVPWDTSWQLRRDLNVIRTNRSDTLCRLVNYFLSLMTRGCHWLRIRVRHLSRKESSFPAAMSLIKSVGAANRQSPATPRKFVAMYHTGTPRLGCVLTNANTYPCCGPPSLLTPNLSSLCARLVLNALLTSRNIDLKTIMIKNTFQAVRTVSAM